jgi:ATP-dependent exoDNAse (exonuclease V) beta subunit
LLPHFRRAGIPVRFGEAKPPFSDPPLDAVAAALRLALTPGDFTALETLLISGLGWESARARNFLSLRLKQGSELLSGPGSKDLPADPDWDHWISLQHAFPRVLKSQGVSGLLRACVEALTVRRPLTDIQRLQCEFMAEQAAKYNTDLAAFLQDQILSPYADPARERSEAVRLLTFHAAKGLEFPVVFMAGTEEGATPLLRPGTDLEEERRLFYVAMTRAQNRLYFTHAALRERYGEMQVRKPSRFLQSFPQQTAESGAARKAKPRPEQQLSLFGS